MGKKKLAVAEPKKSRRPAKGDQSDQRCAFIDDPDRAKHDPVTDEEWCCGCEFYICNSCEGEDPPMGRHDVMDHVECVS